MHHHQSSEHQVALQLHLEPRRAEVRVLHGHSVRLRLRPRSTSHRRQRRAQHQAAPHRSLRAEPSEHRYQPARLAREWRPPPPSARRPPAAAVGADAAAAARCPVYRQCRRPRRSCSHVTPRISRPSVTDGAWTPADRRGRPRSIPGTRQTAAAAGRPLCLSVLCCACCALFSVEPGAVLGHSVAPGMIGRIQNQPLVHFP